jgi:hypothetical protein
MSTKIQISPSGEGGDAPEQTSEPATRTESSRYRRATDHRLGFGTSYRRDAPPLTYHELVRLLGPTGTQNDTEGKTSSEWVLEDGLNPGAVVTVYDYRAGRGLRAPTGRALERFRARPYAWHLGAKNEGDAEQFVQWLRVQTASRAGEPRGV